MRIHPNYSPDFRKNPKTDFFCAYCQKDIYPGKEAGFIYLTETAGTPLHPEDYKQRLTRDNDIGFCPVGTECAKKIGKEWLFERMPEKEIK